MNLSCVVRAVSWLQLEMVAVASLGEKAVKGLACAG